MNCYKMSQVLTLNHTWGVPLKPNHAKGGAWRMMIKIKKLKIRAVNQLK